MGAPEGNSFLSMVGWLAVVLSLAIWPSWWLRLTSSPPSVWTHREIAPVLILSGTLVGSSGALSARTSALLVRCWLLLCAIFELPEIYKCMAHGATLKAGYYSTLADADAERRLWSFALALIVLARLLAFYRPDSRAVRLHCAAVHVAELFALGNELLAHNSAGDDRVFALIMCAVPCAHALLSAALTYGVPPSQRQRLRIQRVGHRSLDQLGG